MEFVSYLTEESSTYSKTWIDHVDRMKTDFLELYGMNEFKSKKLNFLKRHVEWHTNLPLIPRSWICGDLLPLPLYAFIACCLTICFNFMGNTLDGNWRIYYHSLLNTDKYLITHSVLFLLHVYWHSYQYQWMVNICPLLKTFQCFLVYKNR
jgi:hypothetical protein